MNKYDLLIEDIYDKNKNKNIVINQSNVQLAHKDGLGHCNALREEIVKISSRGKIVYSLRSGFMDNE